MSKLEKISPEKLTMVDNPFASSLVIPVNERPGGHERQSDGTYRPKSYKVETTDYTRIFTTSRNSEKVFGLSGKAQELLLYIIFNIEQARDYIQIDPRHYKRTTGISSDNTLLAAKKELAAAGFICPSGVYRTVYWINPDRFFPGNRISKYKGHLDIKSKHNGTPISNP